MYTRRLLLSTQHQHVLHLRASLLSTTPSTAHCCCCNSRSNSSNTSGDEINLLQLFRDISDRSVSSRRDKVGRVHPTTSAANLTSNLCRAYLSLPNTSLSQWRNKGDEQQIDPKQQFMRVLLDEYAVDRSELSSAIKAMQSHSSFNDKSISRLRDFCTPHYERCFHYILHSAHDDLGVAFMVKLRQDILDIIHYTKFAQKAGEQDENDNIKAAFATTLSSTQYFSKLQTAERCIQTILTSLFRPGVLILQRITYEETPAAIIEQIALKEAVHPLQSLNDLRTRLGPGRRCFAFFHPALPHKPLVFVHVSLLQQMPKSMEDIHAGSEKIVQGVDTEQDASCATFYSITNTEPGLSGVDLGNHLIKSVVKKLKQELPKLDTFCTLSPMPSFNKWLQGKIAIHQSIHDATMIFTKEEMRLLQSILPSSGPKSLLDSLLDLLKTPKWHSDAHTTTLLKPLLLKLAAYYLTVDTHHGRPLCPVAKFHIRNGAEMFRLNYLADTSLKGMRNSFGIMINYHYPLDEIESNQFRYEMSGEISVRDGVICWLDSALKPDANSA
jgi:malonyl-CoA decarboxylase